MSTSQDLEAHARRAREAANAAERAAREAKVAESLQREAEQKLRAAQRPGDLFG